MKRYFLCNKCGDTIVVVSNGGEPMNACCNSVPFRTSELCGGSFTIELVPKNNDNFLKWLNSEINKNEAESKHCKIVRNASKGVRCDDKVRILKMVKLQFRSDKITLLERFALFLEKEGYTDTDWRCEEPFTIDEFLKQDK